MALLATLLIALIALLHVYIMWFEMFAWESRGPKVFASLGKDLFPKTKAMAANQGLYNGFLAAGLIWSLVIADSAWSQNVALFFLACVFVAGVYGAATVSKRIIYVQSVPSGLAILALLLS
ncbi:MAG: hypothetical protein COB65_03555 [Thalassobium sp.]|uniref:DUF1304 domain-containing protein n=1 Tax=Octadecabacter sp. SW4 TaxID=2602067 RepID=UPI000C109123|nr:DUF1304 domain-containing protein [Octadecabacter sp. SW4]PHQ85235.1 MAG: hypothetical protein COB65_03555 [Thalassobium sp.]QEE36747.1 DUF1304 domain-containing protein [Octadecabacter sp. SW4]|tara:strand:- start:106 stop:468 length:363 start_codon:yes stop_codon:yes gene_type:complete